MPQLPNQIPDVDLGSIQTQLERTKSENAQLSKNIDDLVSEIEAWETTNKQDKATITQLLHQLAKIKQDKHDKGEEYSPGESYDRDILVQLVGVIKDPITGGPARSDQEALRTAQSFIRQAKVLYDELMTQVAIDESSTSLTEEDLSSTESSKDQATPATTNPS